MSKEFNHTNQFDIKNRMAGAAWGFFAGCLLYLYLLIGTVTVPQEIITSYLIQLL